METISPDALASKSDAWHWPEDEYGLYLDSKTVIRGNGGHALDVFLRDAQPHEWAWLRRELRGIVKRHSWRWPWRQDAVRLLAAMANGLCVA